MDKKNIAWLMLGDAAFGGAEKRMANLFQYLVHHDDTFNYYLFISDARLKVLMDAGIITDTQNVIIHRHNAQQVKKEKKKWYILVKKITPQFLKKLLWFYVEWKIFKNNKRIIQDFYNKYNIGIAHVFNEMAFVAGVIHKHHSHPKVLLTYADPTFYFIRHNIFWFHKTYKHVLKNADFIDVLGEYHLAGLQKRGYCLNQSNYSVSPCSFIDYSKTYIKPKRNLIVHVSRLVESKNPLYFVEVAKKIIEKYEGNVYFKICGRGPQEKQVRELIEKYQLLNYINVEYCTDVIAVLSESSIFLSLLDFGNNPNQALMEAMACKNVVIATNVDDTYKILPEGCGILVNKDINEIVDKTIEVLNNPKTIETIGNNARNFIMKHFTVEKYANYILDIYKKLSNE